MQSYDAYIRAPGRARNAVTLLDESVTEARREGTGKERGMAADDHGRSGTAGMDGEGEAGGAGARLAPHAFFTVPAGVRHLDTDGLTRLVAAFKTWSEAPRRSDARRARQRMRLLFLLLRYSGARLGEATALTRADLDLDLDAGAVVLGGGGHRRTVPLARVLCRELALFLDGPMGAGLDGPPFAADPGYVRRVFYARAEEAGLPRELGTPRAVRTSRAVELLRSGVPLAVVRDVLGQSSADLTALFQAYSSEDALHIVRRLAPDDMPLRTSARNSFPCRVERVSRDGVLAEIALRTYDGAPLFAIITVESALNLALGPGVPVMATIKAPLVELVQADGRRGCARNAIAAVVTEVRSTEVVAEVMGESADGSRLCALVSARTLAELGIGPGDLVQFRFKAMAVVLGAL